MYGVCAKCGRQVAVPDLMMIYGGVHAEWVCKDVKACVYHQLGMRGRAQQFAGIFNGRHYDYFTADDVWTIPVQPPMAEPEPLKVAGILYIPVLRVPDEYYASQPKLKLDEISTALVKVGCAEQKDYNNLSRTIYIKINEEPLANTELVKVIPWAEAMAIPEFYIFALGVFRAGGAVIPTKRNDDSRYCLEVWMPIEGQ